MHFSFILYIIIYLRTKKWIKSHIKNKCLPPTGNVLSKTIKKKYLMLEKFTTNSLIMKNVLKLLTFRYQRTVLSFQ